MDRHPVPSVPPELANHPQYEVVKELGRGGMGTVYLARNRMMDRFEVLKVVNQALLDRPEAAERFLREIRSAARLSHPNVVTAYTALQLGGVLAFAMEYAPGEDLGRVVADRGRLPVPNACYYTYQAALGLQHAHEKGMVHRDIKPSNLVLVREGRKRTVKILDFGLAKATSEKAAGADLTGTGMLLGTPEFIAPEQTIDAARADIRADVYGLGCTLYYLLAGKPPFSGPSVFSVLLQHRDAAAEPLDQLRPDVPAALAAVVSKMMAKAPADRYQTPGEAAKALAPFFRPGGETGSNYAVPPPVLTAEPVSPPPETAGPARVTVIREGDLLPARTAHLNADDFAAEAPPPRLARKYRRPRRRNRWARPVLLGAVALALLAVAVIQFGRRPGSPKDGTAADAGTTATADPKGTGPGANPLGLPGANPSGDGFVALFNGRDLSGWRTHPSQPAGWAVENGRLVGRGKGYAHLYSDRGDFADVHVKARARVSDGGNGGLYVRAGGEPVRRGSPVGYLAQIDANGVDSNKTGSLFLETGDKVQTWPAPDRPPPAGEWFLLEVIARGNRITTKVNGTIAVDQVDPDGKITRGHVALQVFRPTAAATETVIEYESIEVRPLTP